MIICEDTNHRIQGSESYLTLIYNHFCDILLFWQKERGAGTCKMHIYPLFQNMQIIDPYNNKSWQGVTGMARAGGLTGSYFLNVDLTGVGCLVAYLTSFWKASSWQMSDVRYWSVSQQVVALEKKVRRLTQRGVSETDSSDNKLSRARLTLSERHTTHMYTSEGGRGGQTDWYNYRYQLHSLYIELSTQRFIIVDKRGVGVEKQECTINCTLLNDRQ